MKRGISLPDTLGDTLTGAADDNGLGFSSLVRMMLLDSVQQGRLRAVLRVHANVLRAEAVIDTAFARRALLNRADSIIVESRENTKGGRPLRYEDAISSLRACAEIARNRKWNYEHKEVLKILQSLRLRPVAEKRPRWREPSCIEHTRSGSWKITCGWCRAVTSCPLEPVKCIACGVRFRPPPRVVTPTEKVI